MLDMKQEISTEIKQELVKQALAARKFAYVPYSKFRVGAAVLGRSKKSDTGALSSKVGFIGLARKAMILGIVLLAAVLDRVMGSAACTGAVTLFYIVNESLSILENAVLLGVPIPEKLRQTLDIAKKEKGTEADGSRKI